MKISLRSFSNLIKNQYLLLFIIFFAATNLRAYSIEFGSANLTSDNKLVVPLFIDSASLALGAYNITIIYDSNKIKYESGIGIGSYFSSSNSSFLVNNKNANILIIAGQQYASLSQPIGRTQVASLTFSARQPQLNTVKINITTADIYDTNANFLKPLSHSKTLMLSLAPKKN